MAKPKLEKELRYLDINPNEFLKVEKRAEGEEEKDVMVLEGYPITFNQETLIGDEEWGWIESIDPHAVDEADMRDTCLKYNHNDTSPIMARTRNGSLKLTIDDKGVFMRAELIDTQSNKDFYKMVKAGLLDKMSFAFTVEEEDNYNSKPMKRIIKRIGKLFDVSVVDIPAYDSTSLIARSKAMAEAQLDLLENRSTEEAELENKATEGQEEEPKTMPTELENEVDSVKDSQEAKPDDEERKKVFEVAKRKAQAKVKLIIGGIWKND